MRAAIPVLRIFDEKIAREFYLQFLGFQLDWEHRFADGMPLYLQISRQDCVLHLSEHYGDATPGGHLRIEVPDLDNFLTGLRVANHSYCRPGQPVQKPWGFQELTLTDPFGNRLTLYAPATP